jgi:uncharacterized protein YggE
MDEKEEFNYTIEEQKKAFENTAQVRIQTLTQIMKIIDTANKRGAFQASEMSFIGNIYDALSTGVNQAMKKAKKELLYQKQQHEDLQRTKVAKVQIQQPPVQVVAPVVLVEEQQTVRTKKVPEEHELEE